MLDPDLCPGISDFVRKMTPEKQAAMIRKFKIPVNMSMLEDHLRLIAEEQTDDTPSLSGEAVAPTEALDPEKPVKAEDDPYGTPEQGADASTVVDAAATDAAAMDTEVDTPDDTTTVADPALVKAEPEPAPTDKELLDVLTMQPTTGLTGTEFLNAPTAPAADAAPVNAPDTDPFVEDAAPAAPVPGNPQDMGGGNPPPGVPTPPAGVRPPYRQTEVYDLHKRPYGHKADLSKPVPALTGTYKSYYDQLHRVADFCWTHISEGYWDKRGKGRILPACKFGRNCRREHALGGSHEARTKSMLQMAGLDHLKWTYSEYATNWQRYRLQYLHGQVRDRKRWHRLHAQHMDPKNPDTTGLHHPRIEPLWLPDGDTDQMAIREIIEEQTAQLAAQEAGEDPFLPGSRQELPPETGDVSDTQQSWSQSAWRSSWHDNH
jgi:hypothetical protein